MSRPEPEATQRDRLALALFGAAALAAALLLLWEGRGQTFFVDEWGFGYLFRQDFTPHSLLLPDNGHLAALPVLISKASLAVFGAGTALPPRMVAVATHVAIASMLFVILRRPLGALGALAPAILFLFLGAAGDVLVGSHALPIELSAAAGLGAWLALRPRTAGWDACAAVLLVLGIASNGFALPFLAGAAAILLLDPGSSRRRLWIVLLPLALYVLWRLTEGSGDQSDFAIANVAGVPAFAFSSLAAELAAVTGLFTEPGGTQNAYQLGAGQALAGAMLVALAVVAVARGYRPPRAALPALVALVVLWLATGMVASPARQPQVGRYVYCGVLLLLLVAGEAIAALPERRRGAVALACVCAIGLIPNIDAIRDAGTFFREQSSENRAVLGAADLVPAAIPGEVALELEAEQPSGGYADLAYGLDSYRSARARFGTPAFSPAQLRASGAASREDADLFLVRALALAASPAESPSLPIPAGTRLSEEGGRSAWRGGCAHFEPLTASARLFVPLPPGGLWIEPDPGLPVPLGVRRLGDAFVGAGEAVGGRATQLRLPAGPASRDWEAQLTPKQPVLVCGLAERPGSEPAE